MAAARTLTLTASLASEKTEILASEKTEILENTEKRVVVRSRVRPSDPRYQAGDRQYRYAQVAQRFPPAKVRLRDHMIVVDKPEARYMQYNDDPRPRRRQLREFEVVRKLGSGAYGTVLAMALKALHKREIRQNGGSSIKNTYDLHPWQDYKNVELANLAALPWSPFVANLLDTYADTRNLYLLTELGACGALSAYIAAHGALPAAQARFFLANVAAALEFVHGEGLVHGDVKAANLFLGADGYLLLGDFGMARRARVDDAMWEAPGTLQFTPPEYVRAQPIARAHRRHIDWWGAACVLYEMGTGTLTFPRARKDRPVHKGKGRSDDEELKQRIKDVRYTWPRNIAVDEDLKDLVDRMLKKDPEERYAMTRVPASDGSAEPRAGVDAGLGHSASRYPDWKNMELRRHPFMSGFPWKALHERTLLAPFVPEAEPDMREGWHTEELPRRRDVPFLPVKQPPAHFKWDNRYTHVRLEKGKRPPPPEASDAQARPAKRRKSEQTQNNEDEEDKMTDMLKEIEQQLLRAGRREAAMEQRKRKRDDARDCLAREEERVLKRRRAMQPPPPPETARAGPSRADDAYLNSPSNPFAPRSSGAAHDGRARPSLRAPAAVVQRPGPEARRPLSPVQGRSQAAGAHAGPSRPADPTSPSPRPSHAARATPTDRSPVAARVERWRSQTGNDALRLPASDVVGTGRDKENRRRTFRRKLAGAERFAERDEALAD